MYVEKNFFKALISIGDNYNKLLIQMNGGLYNLATDEFNDYNVNYRIYTSLQQESRTFLGTDHGLFIHQNSSMIRKLKNELISGIITDNFGKLYLSTHGNGVFIGTEAKPLLKENLPELNTVLTIYDNTLYSKFNNSTITAINKNEKYQYPLIEGSNSAQKKILHSFSHENTVYGIQDDENRTLMKLKMSPRIGFKKIIPIGNGICFGNNSGFYKLNYLTSKVQTIIGRNFYQDNSKNDTRILYSAKDLIHDRVLFNTHDGLFELMDSQYHKLMLPNTDFIRFEVFKGNLFAITSNGNFIRYINYRTPNAKLEILEQGLKDFKIISSTQILIVTHKDELKILTLKKEVVSINRVHKALQTYELKNIFSDSTYLYVNDTPVWKSRIHSLILPNTAIHLSRKNIETSVNTTQSENLAVDYNNRKGIRINYLTISSNGLLKYMFAVVTDDLDTSWTATETPNVQLVNPSWGEYKILFKAYDEFNTESNIVTTTLLIKKPFYATWWFITLLVLSAILITFLITRQIQNTRRKREKKFLTSEFKALNALMNPHFIFNSLNNIQGFINDDQKKKANEYLEIFSKLIRQNMHNVNQGVISMEKEIILVKNYLVLEKMRMGDRLNYSIHVDESIDLSEIEIPPLTIQPIVENSVKHGIFPLKTRNGNIDIQITEEENIISVVILDTGIGLSQSKKSEDSNSIGLENTKRRFANLSKILDKELSIHVEDRKINEKIIGTKTEITIKEYRD